MEEKFVQTPWIEQVLPAALSLCSQPRKVQQALLEATLPKLSQALAFFPPVPSTLSHHCFSAQKNTHKNNQQNLYILQAGAWSCGEESGHR